jgi:uncharacterized protein YecT (DUF1311 family)
MKILLPALLLLCIPHLARAEVREEVKKIDATMSACLAEHDAGDDTVMKNCTGSALKATDKVLSDFYQAEEGRLKKQPDEENLEYLKRLQSAQRAWASYRDSNSSLHGITNFEGSVENLEILSTKLEMTKDRVLELEELFNQEN